MALSSFNNSHFSQYLVSGSLKSPKLRVFLFLISGFLARISCCYPLQTAYKIILINFKYLEFTEATGERCSKINVI